MFANIEVYIVVVITRCCCWIAEFFQMNSRTEPMTSSDESQSQPLSTRVILVNQAQPQRYVSNKIR